MADINATSLWSPAGGWVSLCLTPAMALHASVSTHAATLLPGADAAMLDALASGFTLTVTLLVLGAAYTLGCARRGPVRGFGSGENSFWNRRIRTERPVHARKHYKLEHTWLYAAHGARVDMHAARTGGDGAITATDAHTGAPLSGHLIGRSTWMSAGPVAAALSRVQRTLTYDPSKNVNAGDKLLRAQMLHINGGDPHEAEPSPPRGHTDVSPADALALGWDFFAKLQTPAGDWAGDYGGPMFLMPGLVITCYVAGIDLHERKSAMITYLRNHQQTDGGWGLHIEGPSTVFGTSLNYVACRLLGLAADDPACVAARAFLHAHGGACANPHWGKFWLAVLGVYEWEGVNPVPPELWLLPYWFPFHPGKMWCHCRMVYLPMSYIYGVQYRAPSTPLTSALRQELYTQPYETINWDAQRNNCASIDLYAPHTWYMEALFWAFRQYEKYAPSFIRQPILRAGVQFAIEYCQAEDEQTNYVDIGPVNKVINMLSAFVAEGAESERFQRHIARIDDYLWVAEDGMKMQGYNGSQLWDTAFAMQALAASGLAKRHEDVVRRVHSYVDASQIKNDVPKRERFFRTISKGGWPFSTNDHGWPIADCTSEGMLAALAIRSLVQRGEIDLGEGFADGFGTPGTGLIAPHRFYDSIDVLWAFRNPDGGWATYEEMRGGSWYEFLNPAEVFGDIMIDYTYTELTSSVVQGLVAFQRHFPHHRPHMVQSMIDSGVAYVRNQQRDDGSWYGSWAVCFTYGCWFGVEALVAGGDPSGVDAPRLKACVDFLIKQQNPDGGWGENYLSCLTKQYSSTTSQVVNTAWAVLALIHAGCTNAVAVRRAVDFLIARQCSNGDWEQELVSGIFNRTCSITYTAYRNVFPLWALAAYVNDYPYQIAQPIARTPLAIQVSPALHKLSEVLASPSPVGHLAEASATPERNPPSSRRSRRRGASQGQ